MQHNVYKDQITHKITMIYVSKDELNILLLSP